MSISCLLVPRSDASPDQLRRLGRAIFDWHLDPASNCSWLEHDQILDMFAGNQPRPLTSSRRERLAELEPADRDRVTRAWLTRDTPGLSFSIFQGNFDRDKSIASLQQFLTPDVTSSVQDLLIGEQSW